MAFSLKEHVLLQLSFIIYRVFAVLFINARAVLQDLNDCEIIKLSSVTSEVPENVVDLGLFIPDGRVLRNELLQGFKLRFEL